jgi:homoserine O-acetyltransferase/O-succinyltransferase
VVRNHTFANGETLPEVRLHYRTVGTPRKDANGVVINAVLLLHGTGDSGQGLVSSQFGGPLFGNGQPLDAERYFIVVPDNLGHGRSSKPSDGLRTKFPQYRYTDMVRLQHRLVTEGLGLTRLRLVVGLSMGAMHTWMWGYMGPGFADGLVALASNPVQIAGRNRIWRKLIVDAITKDPTWKNGDYTEPPAGLSTAIGILRIATSSPVALQQEWPSAEAADRGLAAYLASEVTRRDANDLLYAFRASEDYDPSLHLEKITAALLAINSADDFVNPPDLPMMRSLIGRVKRGRFVEIPVSDETRGHSTIGLPRIWGPHLARFLKELP